MGAGAAASISSTMSFIFRALLIRTKLYQTVQSETIWQWFSNFFECAFVNRVLFAEISFCCRL